MISSQVVSGLYGKDDHVIMTICEKNNIKNMMILLLALRACNASIRWKKSCNSGTMMLQELDGTDLIYL